MLLAAAVIIAVAGCGEKEPEQTSAIQVENPPERPAPEPPPAPPMPTPPPRAQVPPQKKTVTKDGWTVYESGLKYKETKTGDGMEAMLGDLVTVHYKGWLDSGKVFDSSKRLGPKPFSFHIGAGRVIRGWDEGIQGMKVGGKRELTIPPELGYGSEDKGTIPPNSTLHFDVELLEVKR